jgi:hypothetical protein
MVLPPARTVTTGMLPMLVRLMGITGLATLLTVSLLVPAPGSVAAMDIVVATGIAAGMDTVVATAGIAAATVDTVAA